MYNQILTPLFSTYNCTWINIPTIRVSKRILILTLVPVDRQVCAVNAPPFLRYTSQDYNLIHDRINSMHPRKKDFFLFLLFLLLLFSFFLKFDRLSSGVSLNQLNTRLFIMLVPFFFLNEADFIVLLNCYEYMWLSDITSFCR